jgi:hypothetical protein
MAECEITIELSIQIRKKVHQIFVEIFMSYWGKTGRGFRNILVAK